jgi:hypothetical protein
VTLANRYPALALAGIGALQLTRGKLGGAPREQLTDFFVRSLRKVLVPQADGIVPE